MMLEQSIKLHKKYLLYRQLIVFLISCIPCQASIASDWVVQEKDSQHHLPDTISIDLRCTDPTLENIKYEEGKFPSEYDKLAGIGDTLSYRGNDNQHQSLLAKSQQILIPGIAKEDGKCKITQSSDTVIEQKHLLTGIERRTYIQYPKTQDWPYRVHGHMIMKFPDDNFTGSGTLVGPNHVLTAAHNLYNPLNKKWAKEVFFAPGRDQNHYPYGDSKGCILLVHEKWHKNNKDKDNYDFGMVILDSPIGMVTGWSGLLSLPNSLIKEWPVSVTGYPGDKGIGNYHSTEMWTMDNHIKDAKPEKIFYEIETYEGQSGGGIWSYKWPGYEGIYTVGVHTGREAEDAEENRGVRISKENFDIILSWLQAYQLQPLSSDSTLVPNALDPLTFLDELEEKHESWKQRAKNGEEEALYQIGVLYYIGAIIQQDYNKAFACFSCAAQKKYSPAFTALGICYEQGNGIGKHPLKAISLYHKAKIKKNAEAMRRLGLLYIEGTTLLKNGEEAKKLLKEASTQGDAEACYHLAKIYDEGVLATQDKATAAQLYQQAEVMGYKVPVEIRDNFITPLSEAEVCNKAFTELFSYTLNEISTLDILKQEASKLTIFICYDPDDRDLFKVLENLAANLILSGISQTNIYLKNKLGGDLSKFDYAKQIITANKVLFIGSSGLKQKYEQTEKGRGKGISGHQIENLFIRTDEQGHTGVIPLWYQGKHEDCFPIEFEKYDPLFLGGNYFDEFFNLLECLYQLEALNEPLNRIREDFASNKQVLTSKALQTYKAQLEEEQAKDKEKRTALVFGILGIGGKK